MNIKTICIIIIAIAFMGVSAQAHEVLSCGITEVIYGSNTTIPEDYIAGNTLTLSYSFTTLNNTPVQTTTNISQEDIGIGEWTVLVTIDGASLYVQEESAGNFSSEEKTLLAGTHTILIQMTSLPNILPAKYIVSSILKSTPCIPVEHIHETTTSSGGSGSGGVGVVTNECFLNIVRYETSENDLQIGTYVPFIIKSDIPVYQVSVKGVKRDSDVAIRTELLKDLSCKLTDVPDGQIYQYVNIFSGVQNDGVQIKFKVENQWIAENNELKINLLRWKDGAWVKLNPTQTGSDDRFTYFEAFTDGFSSFVIIGEKQTITTPTPQVTANQVQIPEPVTTQALTESKEQHVVKEEISAWIFVAMIVAILLALITIFSIKRRPKEP